MHARSSVPNKALFGMRIGHQQMPPAMQTSPPMLIPHFQPSDSLIIGVKSGARRPIPLPPVLMIAAAQPPRLPPSSTAVSQNGPSAAPTAPSERENQKTMAAGDSVIRPRPSSAALMTIPPIGTIFLPIAWPYRRSI